MSFEPYIAKDRVFQDFRFDFHIDNETGKSWYDSSPQQWMPEREWCVSHLKPGMHVVDCGAHHGMLSVIFAKAVGPTGQVTSYEALPSNAETIRKNALLNKLENLVVRPVGVGSANAKFHVDNNASNTVVLDGAVQGAVGEEVTIVRLDDDLPPGSRVDLLKIDVEGHDLQALEGMEKTLLQRPIIDLELHNFLFPDRLGTLQRILARLSRLRYSWTMLGEIFGKPIELGRTLDAQQINVYDNPHLFGVPPKD